MPTLHFCKEGDRVFRRFFPQISGFVSSRNLTRTVDDGGGLQSRKSEEPKQTLHLSGDVVQDIDLSQDGGWMSLVGDD